MNKATNNFTEAEWIKWLKQFRKDRYDLSMEESLALRNAIKQYPSVAEEFFYKTLDPMNKGFSKKVFDSYKEPIDVRDIATIIYRAFYDNGSWNRLDSYRGESGFFSWLATGARQAVFTELEELHVIKPPFKLTAKNTNLTIKSMRNIDEIKTVIDLVDFPVMHTLLMHVYVDRMNDDEIMTEMNMSHDVYSKTLTASEYLLKECLIREECIFYTRTNGKTVNLVTEALSDISGHINVTTSEEGMLATEKLFSDDQGFDDLKEVLDQYYPTLPFLEQWVCFVLDRASELNWSQEDKTVFYERFHNHTDPVSLAEQLGRTRKWVDGRYSLKLKLVKEHILRWWQTYAR